MYKLWCIEGALYFCTYPFLTFLDMWRQKIETLFKSHANKEIDATKLYPLKDPRTFQDLFLNPTVVTKKVS